jgi:hypothetical protein
LLLGGATPPGPSAGGRRSGCAKWREVGATHRCATEFTKYTIKYGQGELCRGDDLDPDRLSIGREIYDQSRLIAPGSKGGPIRLMGQVEVRREGAPTMIGNLQVSLFHDSMV